MADHLILITIVMFLFASASLCPANQMILKDTFHNLVESYVKESGEVSYVAALPLAISFGINCHDEQLVAYIDDLGFDEVIICTADGVIVSSISAGEAACSLTVQDITDAISPTTEINNGKIAIDYSFLPLLTGKDVYGFLFWKQRISAVTGYDELPETSFVDGMAGEFSITRELVGLRGILLMGAFGIIIAGFMVGGLLKIVSHGISE